MDPMDIDEFLNDLVNFGVDEDVGPIDLDDLDVPLDFEFDEPLVVQNVVPQVVPNEPLVVQNVVPNEPPVVQNVVPQVVHDHVDNSINNFDDIDDDLQDVYEMLFGGDDSAPEFAAVPNGNGGGAILNGNGGGDENNEEEEIDNEEESDNEEEDENVVEVPPPGRVITPRLKFLESIEPAEEDEEPEFNEDYYP